MGEHLHVVGRPYKNLTDVIYLRVKGALIGIPKTMVVDIKGSHMALEHDPERASAGLPLNPGDPKFDRFGTAIFLEERVRVTYREKLRPDPALASLGEHISTTVEGRAIDRSMDALFIALTTENGQKVSDVRGTWPEREILMADVLDIVFLGPRPVDPAEMV